MTTRAGRRTVVACVLVASMSAPGEVAWAANPTVDECLNANEMAQRLVKAGELRAARQKLLFCQASSCPALVRDDCRDRLDAVDKAMPTIVFVGIDPAGNDLDLGAARVTVDGVPLADRLSSAALAVDPGEHVFRLDLPGLAPAVRKLAIRENEKGRRVVVAFGATPTNTVAPAPAGSGAAVSGPSHLAFYVTLVATGAGLLPGGVSLVVWGRQSLQLTTCAACSERAALSAQKETAGIVAGLGGFVFVLGGIGALIDWPSSVPPSPAPAAPAASLQIAPEIGLGWLGVGGHFE